MTTMNLKEGMAVVVDDGCDGEVVGMLAYIETLSDTTVFIYVYQDITIGVSPPSGSGVRLPDFYGFKYSRAYYPRNIVDTPKIQIKRGGENGGV